MRGKTRRTIRPDTRHFLFVFSPPARRPPSPPLFLTLSPSLTGDSVATPASPRPIVIHASCVPPRKEQSSSGDAISSEYRAESAHPIPSRYLSSCGFVSTREYPLAVALCIRADRRPARGRLVETGYERKRRSGAKRRGCVVRPTARFSPVTPTLVLVFRRRNSERSTGYGTPARQFNRHRIVTNTK